MDDEGFFTGRSGDRENVLKGGQEGVCIGHAEGRGQEVCGLGVDDKQDDIRGSLHDACPTRPGRRSRG